MAGYSLLLGFILVTLLLRLLSVLGIPFSLAAVAACMAPLLVVAWRLSPAHQAFFLPLQAPGGELNQAGSWGKLLVVVCVLLIAFRIGVVVVEMLGNPMFPWDSKQHWAKEAKVFLAHGEIVEHVRNIHWLQRGGEGVYTNLHPDYPITIPLITTWAGIALGEWSDGLVHLPWLLCFAILGLIFYGQARAAGVSTVVASVATYMLMSMPLLNVHIALAGYADPFMSVAFLGAIAAFLNFCCTGARWQCLLMLACIGTCILLKNEGFYWALAFGAGLVTLWFGGARGLLLLAALAAAGALLLWLLPPDTRVAGHSIKGMHFDYRPQSWGPIGSGFFVQDNWHLAIYVFVAVMAACAWRARAAFAAAVPAMTVVAAVLALYMVLYLFTGYSRAAVGHTSINRLALHFVPGLLFLAMYFYSALMCAQEEVNGSGGNDQPERL